MSGRSLLFCGFMLGLVPLTAVRAAETITYTYDAQGRLVTVVSSGSVNNGIQTVYAHDPADNRQRVTVTGAPS